MPVIRGRNTYQPFLVGHVVAHDAGSRIRLVETFHPIQIGFILLFFGLPAVFGVRASGWHGILVVLLFFVVFHCVMYFIGFLPEVRRAEERIRELTA